MKSLPSLTKFLPYAAAFIIFLGIAFAYCSPVMEGKIIRQTDVLKARGMQKELVDYHKKTGDYTLWTNSMFGGMPTYQIGGAGVPQYNVFAHLGNILRLNLPKYSVDIIFVYLIGFFILLMALGVNPWLCIIGAIGFAFSSYNIQIIVAGHVNKAFVIGIMPAVLGGVLLIYRKKYLAGAIITIISFGMHLYFNHFQMTYYLLIILAVFFFVELVSSIRKKKMKVFLISTSIVAGSMLIAIIPNMTNIILTYEYSKDTIRGDSELTLNKDEEVKNKGLDRDYALAWSYGKMETFTLLIPNFYGGASASELSENSKSYKALISNGVPRSQAKTYIKNLPTYWGDLAFTSGPVYFGAIICFLFILGLYLIDKKTRRWILIATGITIALSWGRNFGFFTDLFFYNVPMYNKFRAVMSILVTTSILFPLVAFLGLKRLIEDPVPKKEFYKYLKISFGITGGLTVFFLLFGGSMFSFISPNDSQLEGAGYPIWFIEAIQADRLKMLRADAFRSLVFISISAGLVWGFYLKKLSFRYFVIFLGLAILIDMWGVDKRYLNNDSFSSKRKANQFTPTKADLQILKDTDPNFRVYNLTRGPFAETYTSYYHKSIGGYHGAKLKRYQEIIDYHLSKNNEKVLNMLNTKYFIVPGQDQQPVVHYNPEALGNAWFINETKIVENADEEILALYDFDPGHTVIIDKRYLEVMPAIMDFTTSDSLKSGDIKLADYEPNHLTYESNSATNQFAVFSEIYYNSGKGWNAYIDGEKAEHIRVDYILRGMMLPSGTHTIEFKFEPSLFYKLKRIELISSILAAIILLGLGVFIFKNRLKPSVPKVETNKA